MENEVGIQKGGVQGVEGGEEDEVGIQGVAVGVGVVVGLHKMMQEELVVVWLQGPGVWVEGSGLILMVEGGAGSSPTAVTKVGGEKL